MERERLLWDKGIVHVGVQFCTTHSALLSNGDRVSNRAGDRSSRSYSSRLRKFLVKEYKGETRAGGSFGNDMPRKVGVAVESCNLSPMSLRRVDVERIIAFSAPTALFTGASCVSPFNTVEPCSPCHASHILVTMAPTRKLLHRPQAFVRMQSSTSDENGSQACAARIAAAFIKACMPSNGSYVEHLKSFCEEGIAAYYRGYSLMALQLEMSGNPSRVFGRALASDEIELRSVWLTLVFKTLRYLRFPTTSISQNGSTAADAFDRDRLDDFVMNITEAARKGYDLKRIQLEQNLTASQSSEKPRTPVENAILNQSTRLVLTTIQVANEHGDKFTS